MMKRKIPIDQLSCKTTNYFRTLSYKSILKLCIVMVSAKLLLLAQSFRTALYQLGKGTGMMMHQPICSIRSINELLKVLIKNADCFTPRDNLQVTLKSAIFNFSPAF